MKVLKNAEGENLSLSDRVYQTLKTEIAKKEITQDDVLVEGKLADKFGVSKTPVREALISLKQEGWVKPIPRVGYIVTSVEIQDIHEIFQMRIILEGEASSLAAENVSKDNIDKLIERRDQYLKKIKFRGGDKDSEYRKYHDAFHLKIAELANNKRLRDNVERLLHETVRVRMIDPLMSEEGLEEEREDARKMLNAFEEKKSQKAKELMVEHIRESKRRILENMINRSR